MSKSGINKREGLNMKKGNLYLIDWIDTFTIHQQGWADVDDIKTTANKYKTYIHTTGFYIGRYSGYEVVAASLNSSPDMKNWAECCYIPTGCIKKITKL